ATAVSAAISRPSRPSTSPSTRRGSSKTRAVTGSMCCAPTPSSPRFRSCCAIATYCGSAAVLGRVRRPAAEGRGAQQGSACHPARARFPAAGREIAQDVVPFGCDVVPVEAILEFLDEQQGKEGAEHVAANGHVAAVVDGTSGKHGLGLAEQLLDPQ